MIQKTNRAVQPVVLGVRVGDETFMQHGLQWSLAYECGCCEFDADVIEEAMEDFDGMIEDVVAVMRSVAPPTEDFAEHEVGDYLLVDGSEDEVRSFLGDLEVYGFCHFNNGLMRASVYNGEIEDE